MRVFEIALSAGARTRHVIPGRFFMLIEASSAIDVTFESAPGSETGEPAASVEAGFKAFPGDWSNPNDHRFTAFVLKSAAAQTVKIAVSNSAGDYARISSDVYVQPNNKIYSITDVVVTGVVATVLNGNGVTRSVLIQNISASGYIRVAGNTTPTVSRGARLGPGDTLSLNNTESVSAIAESVNVTVAVLYEAYS